MNQMSVGFEKLLVKALVGILPHEYEEPQAIMMNLTAGYVYSSMREDVLEDVIDYRDLASVCEKTALRKHYGLLETMGESILIELGKVFPLSYAKLRIEKPSALPSARHAFIEMHHVYNRVFS
jgi:7,8-dihydroneopterin aldolase/epimerase/oxygenase